MLDESDVTDEASSCDTKKVSFIPPNSVHSTPVAATSVYAMAGEEQQRTYFAHSRVSLCTVGSLRMCEASAAAPSIESNRILKGDGGQTKLSACLPACVELAWSLRLTAPM
jgi:hypothetical protein